MKWKIVVSNPQRISTNSTISRNFPPSAFSVSNPQRISTNEYENRTGSGWSKGFQTLKGSLQTSLWCGKQQKEPTGFQTLKGSLQT
ncbi:MAG: hypothetical protein MjAS7_1986 [Metallosphaera javensis (ex Sakai et al. 2022)]|nr:MAG: hypothetical protein MjAS7_1986 [Metallosphaera javensis (ex Sakai et al. 2022)]